VDDRGAVFTEWKPRQDDGRPWHVIPEMPRYRGQPIQFAPHIEIVRVIDWGYSAAGNPGICVWFACLPDGSAIGFQEYLFKETLPQDAAKEILRRSDGLRVRYTVGDTQMWAEHVGPSVAERFAQVGLSMVEADKEREAGWVEVHNWLRSRVNDGTGERPRLSFLETGCETVIRTLPEMTLDPRHPQDIITVGVEDDGPDVVRYFVMSRPGRSGEAVPDHLPPPSAEQILLRREVAKLQARRRWRLGSDAAHRRT
jgi:hypothetical protein